MTPYEAYFAGPMVRGMGGISEREIVQALNRARGRNTTAESLVREGFHIAGEAPVSGDRKIEQWLYTTLSRAFPSEIHWQEAEVEVVKMTPARRAVRQQLQKEAAPPSMSKIVDTLEDLKELDDNLNEIEDATALHIRIGSVLDPEVNSQLDVLIKSRAGLKAAQETKKQIETILGLDPDDKQAKTALRATEVMIKRFEKHEEAAHRIIQRLSKKNLPPALKKLSSEVTRALRKKLVDPDKLKIIPWQGARAYFGRGTPPGGLEGIEYQVIFRLEDPGIPNHFHKAEVNIAEHTASKNPPYIRGSAGVLQDMSGRATWQKVSELFFEQLRGWAGVKGEAGLAAGREQTAKKILSVLRRSYRLDEEEIGKGGLYVHVNWRGDTRWEDQGQGAREWEHDKEEAKLKKVMAPFKDAIKHAYVSYGEKGWWSIDVALK